MQTKTLIEGLLSGQHEKFLKHCRAMNKTFVEELDEKDFIDYRSKYFVTTEEIARLKRLLGVPEPEPEDSLRKFFKLNAFAPYKGILIAKLDFNANVQYILKFNGYKTLADLLNASRQGLANLRGFSKSSVNNIISTLEKFFEARRAKISPEALKDAVRDLDKFLRDAALKHEPQIDLIITAFREFAVATTKKVFFREKIRREINALPEEIKNKTLAFLVQAINLTDDDLLANVPADLTLNEIPNYISGNDFAFDTDKFIDFLKEFRFDIKTCAKEIVTLPFNNDREITVVRLRASGATLQEISDSMEFSREWARQIEAQSIANFYKHCLTGLKKMLYFLYVITDEKPLLTFNDVKNFIDEQDARLIWFFAEKVNFRSDKLHFDDKLGAFVFEDDINFNEMDLLKNLPEMMEEDLFNKLIEDFAREKNCSVVMLKNKLLRFYKKKGTMFYHGRLTLVTEFGYILKKYFPDGYKIANENSYSKFMHHLEEIFHYETPFTQRNLDANIMRVGVLCGRGKYIHPDFVDVPEEIMNRVKNFIDSSERTAIFYKEIFETLKDIFVGTQITNHYFLQGAIKFYKLPYILRKDYLTKSVETNMAKEFDSFVARRGEVSAQEIKDHFVSFTDANIDFLLLRCPEVIRIGDGIFMHATRLNLREEDFAPIENFLYQNCSPPANARRLFDLFTEHFAEFLTRNEIQNHDKLFGVLQYMFKDKFNFSRPYISRPSSQKLTCKDTLLRILAGVDEITTEDFFSLCKEHGSDHLNKNFLLRSLKPDFIRVDKNIFKRSTSIGITDEIIAAVANVVKTAMTQNGGWLLIDAFKDYGRLPQLKIPWNSFLLESVVLLSEDAPRRIQIPTTLIKNSSTLFLSEEFTQEDFKPFLQTIVLSRHKKKPFGSKQEILLWLQEQGLHYKILPRYLSDKEFIGWS